MFRLRTRRLVGTFLAFAGLALPARAEIAGLPVKRPVGLAAEAETDAWVKTVRDKADHGGWLVVRGTHVGDQAVAALTLGDADHAACSTRRRAR